MALITTVGGVDSNSYITEEEATEILTVERLYSSFWDAADSPTHERALIWATSLLDIYFVYSGTIKFYPQQKLAWPRYGASDREARVIDSDSIPSQLKRATAILAQILLIRDRTQEPQVWALGLSRIKVGPIDLTVDRRRDEAVAFMPDEVIALLVDIAELAPGVETGHRAMTVKLIRT